MNLQNEITVSEYWACRPARSPVLASATQFIQRLQQRDFSSKQLERSYNRRMRRLLLILGIVVAILTSPLLAQMHGGRSGFSGRSSFSPHCSSFAGLGFGSS